MNRCLTEGRRAFLERLTGIESGEECERLAPHLSALADGEADADDLAALRPHLKTCLICRARLREFRAVPSRVAALAPPAALAAGGDGTLRGIFESLVGAAQDKVAAFGERAHGAVELATGQKVAAVAASAAAIAGGGATVDHLSERDAAAGTPAADIRKVKEEVVTKPAPAPVTAPTTVAAPPAAPVRTPPAPATATPAPPQPRPAPSPATEFAPAAAPPPPPTPSAGGGGRGIGGGSGGGGSGSGEFGP